MSIDNPRLTVGANQSGSERAGVDALREALVTARECIWSGGNTISTLKTIDTALATPPAQPAPATTHGKPDGAMREAVALESRLEQVAKVMRSAWVKDIPMEVWADDLKAVEGAILAVRLDEAAIRKDEREKCLLDLQQSYPDHAWLNAACAAIRNGGKQP